MLILLEGSDYSGKSTLAAAIKTAWDDGGSRNAAQVIHTGPPEPPTRCVFQEYEKQLDDRADAVLSQDHLIILDRWSCGDRIYGPKYRGFARYTEGGELHTEMALSSLGAVKAICSPPLEVIQDRAKNRGDDYIDIGDLPRIHAAYLEHAHRYDYHVIDGTKHRDIVITFLLRDARYKAACARELAAVSAGTYTGALWPQCILAGDELGGTPEAQLRRGGFTRPFTPSSRATSSEWLMDALHKANFINTIGMVNVNHTDVNVAALAKLRPEAGWVALGSRASSNLEGHGIPHQRVTHPSFERRFRHACHDEYAVRLSQAIATATADTAFASQMKI